MMQPTLPHTPSAKDALQNFDVRDTPKGRLNEDPQTVFMTDREQILADAATAYADNEDVRPVRLR